jgi:Right handed beta helix region
VAWTQTRAAATGGVCAVALLVGLGLPALIAPARSRAASTLGGGIENASGAGGHVSGSDQRTFYVAPYGRDRDPGTSPAHPWRTVARVDRARLRPGDRVLFAGGATFAGAALMPGEGFAASGTGSAPIVFGSYGNGMARLTRGVWLGANSVHPRGPSHLTFENLVLGPAKGFQGTGDYIKLINLRISHLLGPKNSQETGIATEGSHWVIDGNKISYTGDSGMLLGFMAGAPGDPPGGEDYVIDNNTVSHTGLDGRLSYPLHAMYLKVADARVSGNRLTYFHDDGISLRYRDETISDNYIAHGRIGIAWYQYDQHPGMTRVIHNTIAFTSSAAIFVCGVAESCTRPIESFIVEHNLLHATKGHALNLQPTAGTYLIEANTGL